MQYEKNSFKFLFECRRLEAFTAREGINVLLYNLTVRFGIEFSLNFNHFACQSEPGS